MNTLKQTIQMTLLGATATLLLNACGGGGGGGTTPPPTTNEKVVALCSTGVTTVLKDDKVVAKEANTKVRVVHKQDGTKSVCVDEGKAVVE